MNEMLHEGALDSNRAVKDETKGSWGRKSAGTTFFVKMTKLPFWGPVVSAEATARHASTY